MFSLDFLHLSLIFNVLHEKNIYIHGLTSESQQFSGRLKQYYLVEWCENPTWTLARFFMASGSLTPCSFRSTSICCLISASLARRVARRCSNLQERNKWIRESLASAVHIGTLFFPFQYSANLRFVINLKFSSLSFVVRASPLHRYLLITPFRFSYSCQFVICTEKFAVEFRETKSKVITTANIKKSRQWELKVKIGKLHETRLNARDQITIGFRFESDWLRGWREFIGPITEWS